MRKITARAFISLSLKIDSGRIRILLAPVIPEPADTQELLAVFSSRKSCKVTKKKKSFCEFE